jgi:DNA-binding LytR/AlgR family response regulator
MKFFLEIDKEKEPTVTIVCKKVTRTIAQIEALCREAKEDNDVVYGYFEDEIIPLNLTDVTCFFTRDNKVMARMKGKDYVTKIRIKDVMDLVDDTFIKINQGCVANVKRIKKFSASFGGSLRVFFEDGYSDYVSRREVSQVKRRFGL